MSEVYDVDGWDLNFWFNEHEGSEGWVCSAYPYDKDGEWIRSATPRLYLNIKLTDVDVAELKLGDPVNEYAGADNDLWCDAEWMVASYPHISVSFMPKLSQLPKQVKIVDDELVKVGE